jgi:hypothetical protein
LEIKAYGQNDSSKPQGKDYRYLSEDSIDPSLNTENFISLDPLLGISENGVTDEGRGAGHIIMDAMNIEHWKQLGQFLEEHSIKVHQIIFTAIVFPDPEFFEKDKEMIKTQVGMLEKKGETC